VIYAQTGVPLDCIDFFLGDSSLPMDQPQSDPCKSAVLPVTRSAVEPAVTRLLHIAASLPDTPIHGMKPENLAISNYSPKSLKRKIAVDDGPWKHPAAVARTGISRR
jgi:hypothetical protein